MWKLKLSETKEHTERLRFLELAIRKFNLYEVDTDEAEEAMLGDVGKYFEEWCDEYEETGTNRRINVAVIPSLNRHMLLNVIIDASVKITAAPDGVAHFSIMSKALYYLTTEELKDNITKGAYAIHGDADEVFNQLYAAVLVDGDTVELVRYEDMTQVDEEDILAVYPAKAYLETADLYELLTNTLLTEQTNRLNAVAENQTTLDV